MILGYSINYKHSHPKEETHILVKHLEIPRLKFCFKHIKMKINKQTNKQTNKQANK